jgi:hypothetical protein
MGEEVAVGDEAPIHGFLFNNMRHQDYSQLLLYSSWILFWSNLLNLKTTGPLSSHLKPLKPAHYSGSWRNPASAWIGDCLIGSPGNLDQNPADAPTWKKPAGGEGSADGELRL